MYSVMIAGADVHSVPISPDRDFFEDLARAIKGTWPRPSMMILSFPHNPTTRVVDKSFFERIVSIARENKILIVHDFAYSDLCFDGYQPPSLFEVPEARDVGVELFSMSKSYNMPGWRIGFVVGNKEMIGALTRIKSYLDYGIFQPIQIAAIVALNGPQECVQSIVDVYQKRRDVLIDAMGRAGWEIEKPKATMFVWAKIPEPFQEMGSLEFTKHLLKEAKVAVSPGVGFGEFGEGYVRFALVENEQRIQQAARGIRQAL
jgi:alanine-synthesizing transaminase